MVYVLSLLISLMNTLHSMQCRYCTQKGDSLLTFHRATPIVGTSLKHSRQDEQQLRLTCAGAITCSPHCGVNQLSVYWIRRMTICHQRNYRAIVFAVANFTGTQLADGVGSDSARQHQDAQVIPRTSLSRILAEVVSGRRLIDNDSQPSSAVRLDLFTQISGNVEALRSRKIRAVDG